jgi:uroporphyrin-III C-methyltransferase
MRPNYIHHIKKCKVTIAGAGPGDPDLITYKAILALRKAEVVITDRLVSPAILSNYVAKTTLLIEAGKQGGNAASTSQEEINELLVRYALEGKRVVRLKGGDVSIFSNILSELEALKENDIAYEIIPGVTAASGAAAYCAIPLTARGYSAGVRLLSLHDSDVLSEAYWQELAKTEDTLVFYMSGKTISLLVEKLLQYGVSYNTMLAVVEQATTPLQNVYLSRLNKYEKNLSGREWMSPTVVIIGKVVQLHKQFQWLRNSNTNAAYFGQVEKKTNAVKTTPIVNVINLTDDQFVKA